MFADLSCNINVFTVDILSLSSAALLSFRSSLSQIVSFCEASLLLIIIVPFEVPGSAGGGAPNAALGVDHRSLLHNIVSVVWVGMFNTVVHIGADARLPVCYQLIHSGYLVLVMASVSSNQKYCSPCIIDECCRP